MANYTSLVDIYTSRPDLKKAFPQGTVAGSADNAKLNQWWNNNGVREYPNTILVAPGDSRITKPMTVEEQQAQKPSTSQSTVDPTPGAQQTTTPPQQNQQVNQPDYSKEITNIYLQNFGRTPTQQELDQQNNSIRTGQLSITNLKSWAENHPQNIKKTGEISKQQSGTTIAIPYQQYTDADLQNFHYELSDASGIGRNLRKIYNAPENQWLRDLYGIDGRGKAGTNAEGTTLQTWAFTQGHLDYPEELAAYEPSNVVRARYRFGFRGEDPFNNTTYDPGAESYVDAIRNGVITSYNSLLGKMKLDEGGEWDSLDQNTKDILTIEASIEPEKLKDIPKFSEFFDTEKERANVAEYVDKYYDDQLNEFLKDSGVSEKRTIEDTTSTLENLQTQSEEDLTDIEKAFRNSLSSATEGYGIKGLAFSSQRQEGEKELRETKSTQEMRVEEELARKQKEAEKVKVRTLEDIARDEEKKRKEIIATKAEAKETRLSQKQQQALAGYQALSEGILETEDLKNLGYNL